MFHSVHRQRMGSPSPFLFFLTDAQNALSLLGLKCSVMAKAMSSTTLFTAADVQFKHLCKSLSCKLERGLQGRAGESARPVRSRTRARRPEANKGRKVRVRYNSVYQFVGQDNVASARTQYSNQKDSVYWASVHQCRAFYSERSSSALLHQSVWYMRAKCTLFSC